MLFEASDAIIMIVVAESKAPAHHCINQRIDVLFLAQRKLPSHRMRNDTEMNTNDATTQAHMKGVEKTPTFCFVVKRNKTFKD